MKFDVLVENLLNEKVDTYSENITTILKRFKDPLVGVHFSNTGFNLSLNLKPNIHDDPIAIYSFPKQYVLSGDLERSNAWEFYERKYYFIIKPSNSAKILFLSRLTSKDVDNLLIKMGIPKKYWKGQSKNHKSFSHGYIKKIKPAHRLWSVIQNYKTDIGKPDNSFWNSLFKKVGYNVLNDEGDSIIDASEPSQIAYLETKAANILYSNLNKTRNIKNEIYKAFIKEFQNYIPKSDNKQLILYPAKNIFKHRIQINSFDFDNYFKVKVIGFKKGFNNNYDYHNLDIEEALKNVKFATDDIKEFLKRFKII